MAGEPIRVEGLQEWRRSLQQLESDMPKVERLALGEVADLVVGEARPRVPSRSGTARGTVRAMPPSPVGVEVVGGGGRASYYGWLEFGGRVGRGGSVRRPYVTKGRYIYRARHELEARFPEVMERALVDAARQAGMEVRS